LLFLCISEIVFGVCFWNTVGENQKCNNCTLHECSLTILETDECHPKCAKYQCNGHEYKYLLVADTNITAEHIQKCSSDTLKNGHVKCWIKPNNDVILWNNENKQQYNYIFVLVLIPLISIIMSIILCVITLVCCKIILMFTKKPIIDKTIELEQKKPSV